MFLLEQVPFEEKAAIIASLRGGQPFDLAASRRRMSELGIAGRVVTAIDEELQLAAKSLEPFRTLGPVALMLQLGSMLKMQVATLQTSSISR
jgi:hypothetical protein